jgi:4-hydroxy-tetrahydrodipicolinate reductase
MKKIILSGANGKMGKMVQETAKKRDDCRIVAGIDKKEDLTHDFPIFGSLEKVTEKADVLIDFSHPSLVCSILNFGLFNKLPLVLCTTGLNKEQIQQIIKTSKDIPIFYSQNMSLSVFLMKNLCQKAAFILKNDFDIEIIEKHHKQKIDAPSGTALMLADAIGKAFEGNPNFVFGRHSCNQTRGKNEIGIHAVRAGNISGEHEVIFAGEDEILKITHTAGSRKTFANGAINAAMFLCKMQPGMYNMENLAESFQ